MRHCHSSAPFTIHDYLDQASHLAASDDTIATVTVVPPARPTFREYTEARQIARARNVSLRIDPSGEVSFRQVDQPKPALPARLPRRHRDHVVARRLAGWNAGLPELSEGVR